MFGKHVVEQLVLLFVVGQLQIEVDLLVRSQKIFIQLLEKPLK